MIKPKPSKTGPASFLSPVSKALRIYAGEWPKVLILSAHSALAIAVMILVQSLIVALFLDAYDASLLPYLFTTQALFFVVMSTIHTSVIGKVSRKVETGSLLCLFMFSLAFSRVFIVLDQKWFIFVLYVWMQTLVDILLIQSGILVTAALDTREAKRLFSVVSAGGTVGAVVAGFAVTVLTKYLGTENLLIACLPLLAGMIVIGNKTINKCIRDEGPTKLGKDAEAEGFLQDMKGALFDVLKDRLLAIFLVVLVAMTIASTVVDFQFKSLLKENYSKDEIAAFLGVFFALLNAAALVAQLFVTSPLLISFGLIFSIVLMPVFLLLGSALFMLFPVIWVIAGTRLMENVCKYSVFRVSSSLVYMPFPPLKQSKLRISIGGIFKPFSVLVASFLLIVLGNLELRMMSIIVVSVSALGILASLKLKGPYVDELKQALSNRRIRLKAAHELGDIIDRQAKELVEEGLGSRDKDYVLFSLEIIRNHQIPVNIKKIEALYQDNDSDIIEEALGTIRVVGNRKQAPNVVALLQSSSEPEIEAQCIKILRHIGDDDDHSRIVVPHIASPHPQLCAEALIYLLVKGNRDIVAKAEARVKQLQDSGAPKDLALVAFIIGETGLERYLLPLKALLDSSVNVVKREAVIAAGKIKYPDLLTGLIKSLGDKDISFLARKAIANYGTAAVPKLIRAFRSSEHDLRLRSEILDALGRIPCPESAEALTEFLLSKQRQLGYRALRSLNKIRGVMGVHEVAGFKDRILDSLKQEVRRGRWAFSMLSLLGSETGAVGRHAEVDTAMLADEIKHRISRTKEGIFRRLGLVYDYMLIYKAYLNYMGGDKNHRANSLELLDNVVDKKLSSMFLPLLEDMPIEAIMEKLKTDRGFKESWEVDWCKAILEGDDEWLKALAIWTSHHGVREKYTEEHKMGETMLQTIERIYFLKSVPMFSQLSGEELRPVAEMFSELSLRKGSTIFKENEPGDSFYVILSGTVKVEREGREIALLKEKDYFGEMALLDYETRSASLIVGTDCELLKLNREDFYELLEEYPGLSREIIRTLARRLRALIGNVENGT
jgi:ATP/ADP translocase